MRFEIEMETYWQEGMRLLANAAIFGRWPYITYLLSLRLKKPLNRERGVFATDTVYQLLGDEIAIWSE